MQQTTFAELGVSETVCAALAERGITHPFPVQRLVLPHGLAGRDVLARSPTGSGKTLAFGLPLVERATRRRGGPVGLVLAPTRELAQQIEVELGPLAAARGLRMAVAVGGVGFEAQARQAAVADLLVATPGRLRDLTARRRVGLGSVATLVLDEADRMLDMGFLPQVQALVALLPAERQTMFFSATLDGEVGRLARDLSRDPVRLHVEDGREEGESLAERLEHRFLACTAPTRIDELVGLIRQEEELVLVFCRTRRGADRLAGRLAGLDLPVDAMHGDLTQAARERALARFSSGAARVLVATDVAARGIDLEGIGLVVNFDPPEDRDAYTHRVGRTARAGRTGRAVTLVLPEQADDIGRMARGLGLEEGWLASGHAAPAPKVLYGSRRRGSAFAPGRTPRPRPAAPEGSPRANRVKRGSRPSARPAA